jgi:glutamate/tyrosine decarboxylase-like PLP-dependent enzyme
LRLNDSDRERLWRRVIDSIESFWSEVDESRVAPRLDPEAVRARVASVDFDRPLEPEAAIDFVVQNLREHQVHTSHPGYYGLYNPAPTAMGVYGDAIVAGFNPQLAAWSHSPFAVEVEAYVIAELARWFGYERSDVEGTFASGGMEANHTAVLAALVDRFDGFREDGVRGLDGLPVLYVSREGHDSFRKSARLCGLGTAACRSVAVDERLRLDVDALESMIDEDLRSGHQPFLVAATVGSTSAGVVDPVARIGEVARAHDLWFHVDAAWGGAAAIVPELRYVLDGAERSDSITLDAHKWLSAPMAAGIFMTRHRGTLERTFRVEQKYMPRDARGLDVADPFAHSMQWSRRFIGLKVFLSLAVAGWDGYREVLRRDTEMGELLREKLRAAGWVVVNETPLPVVCFIDGTRDDGRTDEYIDAVCAHVVASGKAWISVARLGPEVPALRACITNFRTSPADLDVLVAALEDARGR